MTKRVRLLTVFGLILNLIGTGIIWHWGAPQPDFSEATALDVEGPAADENAAEAEKRKKTYTHISSAGMGVLAAGFAVQVVATML